MYVATASNPWPNKQRGLIEVLKLEGRRSETATSAIAETCGEYVVESLAQDSTVIALAITPAHGHPGGEAAPA